MKVFWILGWLLFVGVSFLYLSSMAEKEKKCISPRALAGCEAAATDMMYEAMACERQLEACKNPSKEEPTE